MFCVATLQPQQGQQPTLFLRRDEMVRQIDAFYTMSQRIPLCIDHCGAQTCGFVVPAQERIGHVTDLWVNAQGQLMVKLWLDGSHRAFKQINQGIFHSGERWGVSVWLDQLFDVKILTHVALTTNPFFARQGTWLHGWNLYEGPMDREIASKHFDSASDVCYGHRCFLEKLDGVSETVSHRTDLVAAQRPAKARRDSTIAHMDVETPQTAQSQQQAQPQPGQGFSQPQAPQETKPLQTRQEMQDEADGVQPEQYKRQRLGDGPQGEQRQAATQAPEGQGRRAPLEKDVDLENPVSVKRAIRQYEEYMEDSGLMPSKLDASAKLFYSQLVSRAHEQDQQFFKHFKRMFAEQGLPEPDLSKVPSEAQESVFTFVAASGANTERNEAKLKELEQKLASMERERTMHSIKTTSRDYRGPETQTPQSFLPSVSSSASTSSLAATTPSAAKASVDLLNFKGSEVRSRPVQTSYFQGVFAGGDFYASKTQTTVEASHADAFNDFMHLFQGKTAGI
jgi:hypothetical protein